MRKTISFSTTRNCLTDLTEDVEKIVRESGVEDGICVVFSKYTTCSLLTALRGNTKGHEDIQDEVRRLIPTRVDFKHNRQSMEDAAANVKSSLFGASLSFIVEEGRLLLGPGQGIHFMEFDDSLNREVWVQVI